MKTSYTVKVKYGYLAEFEFKAETLREAGYIADTFLDQLVYPEQERINVTIQVSKKEAELNAPTEG